MNRLICLILTALVTGCAGMQDAMTPSASVIRDDFDGKMIVRQAPVSAASSLGEPFHTLGFEWTEKYPNTIFITTGFAFGLRSIQDVAFNADGRIVDKIKQASVLTEFDRFGTATSSSRRFEMSLEDFRIIANAQEVKMRMGSINDYTVSSFGPATGVGAAVNTKFRPFLDQIEAIRSGKKP
jgi:hypothetical protein